jgi:uncharacterized membrane protein YfcA
LTTPALIWAAAVLFTGAVLQSAAGFGFGLFAVPALLVLGFPLPQAVMLCVVGSAVQKVLAVWSLREHVPWKGLRLVVAYGLLTFPLGLWLMFHLTEAGKGVAGAVVAVLILGLLLLRRGVFPEEREHVPAVWGISAGAVSGVLNGLANIGGPPVVLWSLAHKWSNPRLRITTLAQSLVFVPFQMVLIPVMFGAPALNALLWGLAFSPLVILGTRAGLFLGNRVPVPLLRLGMEILLVLMAVSAARPLWE